MQTSFIHLCDKCGWLEAWQKLVYAESNTKLEMEETYLFISNTECINIYIPADADTDTFPVLYHSLLLQNIFVRKNSQYQKPVHSGHVRTARSLWPSENHWGFLFSKKRG